MANNGELNQLRPAAIFQGKGKYLQGTDKRPRT